MIDPKTIELMNLVLDGVASPSQKDDLQRQLAANPTWQAHYDALGRVVRRLETHPLQDPPAHLHARIIDAVDAMPAPRADARGGFLAWSGRVFSGGRFGPIGTFGLGLAAGAFLISALHFGRPGAWDASRHVDPSQVAGAMMTPTPTEPIATASVTADEAGAAGTISFYGNGDETVAEVSFEGDTSVSWTLEFDAEVLAVKGVETPRKGYFTVGEGEVRAIHPGGGRQRVVLSGAAAVAGPLVWKVVRSGHEPVERVIDPDSSL